MKRCCPTCGGTGLATVADAEPVDAELIALKTACTMLSASITWDGFISAGDAARLMGLAPKTLSNNRSDRRPIPFRKIGRRIEYSLKDLAAWRAESIKKTSF